MFARSRGYRRAAVRIATNDDRDRAMIEGRYSLRLLTPAGFIRDSSYRIWVEARAGIEPACKDLQSSA
jgi:hypothetical protein